MGLCLLVLAASLSVTDCHVLHVDSGWHTSVCEFLHFFLFPRVVFLPLGVQAVPVCQFYLLFLLVSVCYVYSLSLLLWQFYFCFELNLVNVFVHRQCGSWQCVSVASSGTAVGPILLSLASTPFCR